MKTQNTLLLVLLTFFAACASTSRSNAHDDVRTVQLEQWDDWAKACQVAIVNNGILNDYREPDGPAAGKAVVAIGDFINSSRRMDVGEDKDVFLNSLSKELIGTKQMIVTRLYGGTAGRVDSVTRNSKELEDDPQFDTGQKTQMANKAQKARLVLSCQYNQKKSNARNGSGIFENYMHIELIDQTTKAVVFSEDVRLKKVD